MPEKPDILAGLPHANKPEKPYRRGKSMAEGKAVYYGQVELIPGIVL